MLAFRSMGNKSSSQKLRRRLERVDPETVPVIPYQNERIFCRVVDVYDGDTCTILLLVNRKVPFKIKLRILGIDTPEKARCSDHEKQAGRAVAEIVKDMIDDRLFEVQIKKWDKYGGRVLGHLYLSTNETLTDFLLEEGLGKAYDGSKKEDWTAEELDAVIEKVELLKSEA